MDKGFIKRVLEEFANDSKAMERISNLGSSKYIIVSDYYYDILRYLKENDMSYRVLETLYKNCQEEYERLSRKIAKDDEFTDLDRFDALFWDELLRTCRELAYDHLGDINLGAQFE